jgi:HlyD family secretion protein
LNINPDSDVIQNLGIKPSKKWVKRLRRFLVLAILLVAAVTGVAFWRKSSAQAKAPVFDTQLSRRGDLTVVVSATGTLEPTNQVEVGSELSGIIETVEVDYNDEVKVGQVLAKLNTEKLDAQVVKSQAALESARANVLQAQASVLETKSELDRMKQVWEKTNKKAPSQNDLDAADAAYKRAQAGLAIATAQVSEAEATLNANNTDLAKAIIRSPINGVVLTRQVEPGQTVAASLQAPTLFTLAEDLAQMELHVDVDEADVGQVEKGQEAVFTVDAYPDKHFRATVTQVRYGAQTVSGVVTYETLLNVNNADLLLRPGMTAAADITVKKVKDALLIPNIALRFSPPETEKKDAERGGSLASRLLPHPPRRFMERQTSEPRGQREQHVWILKDGKPAKVPIVTGLSDGQMTEVVSGDIEPDMPILTGYEERTS